MAGTFAACLNRLPTAMVKTLGVAGGKMALEALPRNVTRDAGLDLRNEIVCRSGAMADEASLQKIGLLLFLATLFVIVAGAFAVRHQLVVDLAQLEAGFTAVKAGSPGASRAVVS